MAHFHHLRSAGEEILICLSEYVDGLSVCRLAAIDGVGGDTGVTYLPRHHPSPSFFFYSNKNNLVQLEQTLQLKLNVAAQ